MLPCPCPSSTESAPLVMVATWNCLNTQTRRLKWLWITNFILLSEERCLESEKKYHEFALTKYKWALISLGNNRLIAFEPEHLKNSFDQRVDEGVLYKFMHISCRSIIKFYWDFLSKYVVPYIWQFSSLVFTFLEFMTWAIYKVCQNTQFITF